MRNVVLVALLVAGCATLDRAAELSLLTRGVGVPAADVRIICRCSTSVAARGGWLARDLRSGVCFVTQEALYVRTEDGPWDELREITTRSDDIVTIERSAVESIALYAGCLWAGIPEQLQLTFRDRWVAIVMPGQSRAAFEVLREAGYPVAESQGRLYPPFRFVPMVSGNVGSIHFGH